MKFQQSYFCVILFPLFTLAAIQRKFQVSEVANCENIKNAELNFSDFRVVQKQRGKYYASGTLLVPKGLSEDFSATINLKQCADRANSAQCYDVLTIADTKLCGWFKHTQDAFAFLLKQVVDSHGDGVRACPVNPDKYTLKETFIRDEFMQFLPYMKSSSFRTRVELYDRGLRLGCLLIKYDIIIRRTKA